MPDSYRLKPHGGPLGGNVAGHGVALAFTATRLSAVPPSPPTPRSEESKESRDRESGHLPEGGDGGPKAPTPAPMATLRDRATPPRRGSCVQWESGAPAPGPLHDPLRPVLRFLPPLPKRKGGRRRSTGPSNTLPGRRRPGGPPRTRLPAAFPGRTDNHSDCRTLAGPLLLLLSSEKPPRPPTPSPLNRGGEGARSSSSILAETPGRHLPRLQEHLRAMPEGEPRGAPARGKRHGGWSARGLERPRAGPLSQAGGCGPAYGPSPSSPVWRGLGIGPSPPPPSATTCLQKEEAALHDPSLSTIAFTKAGRERSSPTCWTRTRRWTSQAGHSSRVCCAVSRSAPQW